MQPFHVKCLFQVFIFPPLALSFLWLRRSDSSWGIFVFIFFLFYNKGIRMLLICAHYQSPNMHSNLLLQCQNGLGINKSFVLFALLVVAQSAASRGVSFWWQRRNSQDVLAAADGVGTFPPFLSSFGVQHFNKQVVAGHVSIQVFVVKVFFGLQADGSDLRQPEEQLAELVRLLRVVAHNVVQQRRVDLLLHALHQVEVFQVLHI